MRCRAPKATPLGLTVLVAACVPTSTTAVREGLIETPELPSVESIEIDLGFFEEQPNAPVGSVREEAATRNHWTQAAMRVAVADAIVSFASAVPVATWAAAVKQTPVYEPQDNRWHWRFTATESGLTYGGDLSGIIAGSQAAFEMRLSQEALGLSAFLWYTGVTPVGGESGFWQFRHPQFPGEGVGRIDWSHRADDTWILTFSAEGGGENDGDVLTYEESGTRRLMVHEVASSGNVIEIRWDMSTGEGQITADDYNGGVRSCWDGNGDDAVCGS